jgi:hypothetical protein
MARHYLRIDVINSKNILPNNNIEIRSTKFETSPATAGFKMQMFQILQIVIANEVKQSQEIATSLRSSQ